MIGADNNRKCLLCACVEVVTSASGLSHFPFCNNSVLDHLMPASISSATVEELYSCVG